MTALTPTIPSESHRPGALEVTAFWTAAARAAENCRDDRLVADPWAAALAGEPGTAWLADRAEGSTLPIILRTRYFDDCLMRVAADGMAQFVLMAAGLDTRAYRLAWPSGAALYELDRGEVLEHKRRIMGAAGAQPGCLRWPIDADLTEPWREKLVKAGFDASAPACWLLEGFLFYLPTPQVESTLDAIAGWASPGSCLGFDIVNAATLTHPLTRPWIEMQAQAGAPWLGTMEDPAGFLAQRGWVASLSQAGQPDANHGRWKLPVLPTTMPGVPHNWFVTATKPA